MGIRPIAATITNDIFSFDTYLTAEGASIGTELTVKSISNFTVDQILLVGELGDENSEIIKTHAATSPTGTTITLASGLVKTHGPYTKIRVMLYNQVEFSYSATETGSKTVLDTINIQPEKDQTRYDEDTYDSGFYFMRFKNDIDSSFSVYTDAIPYSGFGSDTVSFAIQYALKRNKLNNFTDFIDYQLLIDETNACLKFIDGKLKGWTKLLKLNEIIGQTSRGTYRASLPSNILENRGAKSITDVRMGTGTSLIYKIWSSFEKEMQGVVFTQVTTEASAGDVTLEIDNSYDFQDTGSVNVYVSGVLQTITYTGVTRSSTAGILTGVPASGTGSITATIPVDTFVWFGEGEGKPTYYSVDDEGYLVYYPLTSAVYENLNIYLDYYAKATTVDSDADTLDAFRFDAVKHWLTWVIRMQLKNDGKRDFTDGDYIQFMQIVGDYVRTEIPGHRKKRRVRMNGIFYGQLKK